MTEKPRTPEENQQEFDKLSKEEQEILHGKAYDEAKLENEKKDKIVVPIEEIIPDIKPKIESGDKEYLGVKSNDFGDKYSFDLLSRLSSDSWNSSFLVDKNEIKSRSDLVKKVLEKIDSMSEEEFEEKIKGKRGYLYEEVKPFFFLRKRFKDKVVVDLGDGGNIGGYYTACLAGAKAYIGVDKTYQEAMGDNETAQQIQEWTKDFFHSDHHSRPMYEGTKDFIQDVPFYNHQQDDMLMFLKRLPDNSVGIFTSGIDNLVMNTEKAENSEYSHQMSDEIERVLDPESGWMAYVSTTFSNKNLQDTTLGEDIRLLTKKKEEDKK